MEKVFAFTGIYSEMEQQIASALSAAYQIPVYDLERNKGELVGDRVILWCFDHLVFFGATYMETMQEKFEQYKLWIAKVLKNFLIEEIHLVGSIYQEREADAKKKSVFQLQQELEKYLCKIAKENQIPVRIYQTPYLEFGEGMPEDGDIRSILDLRIQDFVTWVNDRIPSYFEEYPLLLCENGNSEVYSIEKESIVKEIVKLASKPIQEDKECYQLRNDKTISLSVYCQERLRLQYRIDSRLDKQEKLGVIDRIFWNIYQEYIPKFQLKPEEKKKILYSINEHIDTEEVEQNEVPLQQKQVLLQNGKELVYYTVGQGTPILIVNAYGVDYKAWNPLVSMLSRHYYMIYWNIRGMYDIEKPGEEKDYICGVMDQVKDIEAVIEKEGISKFHLMSWCSGAKAAVFYNIYHPEKLLSQIFVCGEFAPFEGSKPYHSKFRENIQLIAELIHNNPKMLDFYMKIIHNGMFNRPIKDTEALSGNYIYEIMPAKHRECLLAPFSIKETMVNFLNMCMEYYTYDITELLQQIETPVLFIGAECDQVAPYMQSGFASSNVKNSQFSCLVSGTHLVILERTKDVYRLIRQHMKYVVSLEGGENMNMRETVKEYLLANVIHDVEDLEDNQQLIDSGFIDSISIVKVIIFFENEFGISFTEEDMAPANFETLGAMVATIEKKISEKDRR
ncbi:phosphopantetheine-binding protein [[Clostridium] polysaccharolyticum]|uniref:Pimeloyl-ACP methyl ester carboxylesterase n=1 Tax=[Clostridium] polysaccharolyticum TaxID=29364 RepID=A0A1I0C4J2_9FIRM|nr:phosphopantetheine-binding protein [[Clostridium] polysaccharolyticum]SET14202.1 Pimeloyl-ACP methyl ester carboxylesterase [[Clostridium] polysaccharolyticum]